MISIIVAIVVVIVWYVVTVCSLTRFFDRGVTDPLAWVCAAISVWGLAWGINGMVEYEEQHPCVAYETRYTYNPTIKAQAPMRVCVERGEWVE